MFLICNLNLYMQISLYIYVWINNPQFNILALIKFKFEYVNKSH